MEPSRGKEGESEFNRVNKRRLQITKRKIKRRWVTANFGAEVDVRERAVGSKLDSVMDVSAERGDKVGGVVVKLVKLGDGTENVPEDKLILGAPDFLPAFVDDRVLVGVGVVSEVTRRGGKGWEVEIDKRFQDKWKWGGKADRARRGRRGNGNDRGVDNRRGEVLNRDVRERDLFDSFLKLEIDVGVLGFDCRGNRGVLELRT